MNACKLMSVLILLLLTVPRTMAQGDDCFSAIQLQNLTNYCSTTGDFNNVGASPSGTAIPPCWTTAGPYSDVWFSFVAIGTEALIAINGTTMDQPHIALYSGDCNNLTQQGVACTNGIGGIQTAQIFDNQLIQGNTYYIRIGTTVAQEGTFQICINNFTPPVQATADCDGAGKLCTKDPLSVANLAGGGNNTNENAGSCVPSPFTETNSVWYTWTCADAGTLTMDIIPANQLDDIDFIVFQLNTPDPCGPRAIIRCTAASCINAQGSTGLNAASVDITEAPGCPWGSDAYLQQLNMTAGTSYAILIMNASADNGFTINWGGTGTFVGPEAHITSPSLAICTGTAVTLDGSTSENYASLEWNFANGPGSPAAATGPGPHTVTYEEPGTFTAILNAADAAGCTSVASVNITVTETTTPTFDAIGPYCLDEPAPPLPAASTTGITGTWSPSVVSTAAIGTSNYTFTPDNGDCVTTATVSVTINPQVVPSFDPIAAICTGAVAPDLPESSLNGIEGTWSPAVSNITSGSYTFTPEAGSCASELTINVTVHPLPVVEISSNGPVCAGDTLQLMANTFAGGDYVWSGPGLFHSNLEDPTRPFVGLSHGGTYTLQLTDANGCTGQASIDVLINGPTAAFTASETELTQLNTEVTFYNNSEDAIAYQWDFGDNGTSNATDPVHTFAETPGNYNVILVATDENGCTDEALLTIVVREDQIIYVPNAFTPDGDEFNNEFKPIVAEGFDLYSYTLLIYNRWGEVIFESMNTETAWDGTYHGQAVQEGTYTWTIRVKNRTEDKFNTYNGHVLVIR